MMTQSEQKQLVESAAEELGNFIYLKNEQLKSAIANSVFEDTELYDYQTCYKLMLLATQLKHQGN